MKQLLTYFVLAYLISWTIWLPLYGSSLGLHDLPVVPFHHGLGALGPLLASFFTTWVFRKDRGVKALLQHCFQLKPLLYLAIALLSPFVLAFSASLLHYFISHTPMNLNGLLHTKEFPQFSLPSFFLYNLLFFGWGEEAGWRGFALPRLQYKFSAFTSSLVLTVAWALWHLPLFLYRPGYTTMDAASIFGWTLSLLTGSILLSWLFNSSRGSILICAVFHSTVDIAFTADIADKTVVSYMGFLITVWGIATLIIFKPKNLASSERVKISNN